MESKRLDRLKEMLTSAPNDSFLIYAVAKEYEKSENLEQALANYLLLKKLDPNYVGLYYHLGKLYEELAMEEEALMAYIDGISIAKSLSDFHALSELNNAKTNLEMGI